MSIWYHYKKITGLLIGSIILIGFATSLSSQSLSSGDGTARIIGSLESPNNQYDTFLPNLPGSQSSLGLYVVYGPQLEQRTPTIYFDRSSCNTPEDFDFCFDVSYVHREDYFAIFQDLPRTVRDIKLIGPYQFSLLSSNEELATFEQRWYYILYDWYYTRPDGSRSQTFTDQTSCEAEANLVGTNLICKEFIGKYLRHSHYFETQEECLLEAVATTGDAQAQCYTTQIRNVQVLFEVPIGILDAEFPLSPKTTVVGQTSAFLKGSIDTKGIHIPIWVEVFGVPDYNNIYATQNQAALDDSGLQQPYGNTYELDTLSLAQDPNIHILNTQEIQNGRYTNPENPEIFTIAFNPPQGIDADIIFLESLKKNYIYYYRVFNPDYIPDDQVSRVFEKAPTDRDSRQGLTYAQGWFTTKNFELKTGGDVLGGVLYTSDIFSGGTDFLENDIEGDVNKLFNPLDIVHVETIPELVERIFEGFRLIIGPLAAVFVVYIAFLFITSAGKPEERAQTEVTLKYVTIGLGVLVGAYILGLGVQAVVTCLGTGVCR